MKTKKKLLMKPQGNLGKTLQLPLFVLLLFVLLPGVAKATAVNQPPDDELLYLTDGWYMEAHLSDGTVEYIHMSCVGSLVAVDDAYDFTVLDGDGYVVVENVMKAVFKYVGELDAIRTVEHNRNLLGRAADGRLTLIGVSGKVNIFDAGGKQLMSTTAKGGETVVSIAHLPAGVYAVKCGKQTFKFTKK
jgi:hypothetical protein